MCVTHLLGVYCDGVFLYLHVIANFVYIIYYVGSLLSRCLFHFLPTHLLTFWLQTRLSVNRLSETDMLISILKECPLITYMLECFPRSSPQQPTRRIPLENICDCRMSPIYIGIFPNHPYIMMGWEIMGFHFLSTKLLASP